MRRGLVPAMLVAAAGVLTTTGAAAGVSGAATSSTSGGVQDSAATSTSAPAGTSSGVAPVYEIKTGKVPGLGTVLLDGQDYTLYMFAPDKQSGKSTCYGRCASAWPPLLLPSGVSRAPSGPGVKSKLLGTTTRRDGTVQVTYDKWPLYLWVIDSGPRQSTGQGINNLGGKWYVITPAGAIVKRRA
jgi:predicted lipoprotein with Yx(FWY)xxD motif